MKAWNWPMLILACLSEPLTGFWASFPHGLWIYYLPLFLLAFCKILTYRLTVSLVVTSEKLVGFQAIASVSVTYVSIVYRPRGCLLLVYSRTHQESQKYSRHSRNLLSINKRETSPLLILNNFARGDISLNHLIFSRPAMAVIAVTTTTANYSLVL